MTNDVPFPRRRRSDDEPLDLTSVLADERAIELLRGSVCDPADLDDQTLAVLASWAMEARRREFATIVAGPGYDVAKRSRRRVLSPQLRGTVGGAVVTMALMGIGGGVAAAFAGDPLAGLRGLRTAAVVSSDVRDGNDLLLSAQGRTVRAKLKEAKKAARDGDVVKAKAVVQDAQQSVVTLAGAEKAALTNQADQVAVDVGAPPTDVVVADPGTKTALPPAASDHSPATSVVPPTSPSASSATPAEPVTPVASGIPAVVPSAPSDGATPVGTASGSPSAAPSASPSPSASSGSPTPHTPTSTSTAPPSASSPSASASSSHSPSPATTPSPPTTPTKTASATASSGATGGGADPVVPPNSASPKAAEPS